MNAPQTATIQLSPAQILVDVEYIGDKDLKVDNVAGTDIVWAGKGDVQQVTEQAWRKLAKHPEVWRRAASAPPPPPPVTDGKRWVLELGEGDAAEKFVLDDMTVAEIKEFAKRFEIPFTATTKDKLKLATEVFKNATEASEDGKAEGK